MLQIHSAKKDSLNRDARSKLRIGIPKVLNIWSTHQFWIGMLTALGINPRKITFSSDSSEEQSRAYAKGRGTVDCCYPVKCISGHYGELLQREKHKKIDILFSPMIYSLPSFLNDHVVDTLACPRVMAAPENIKAGFLKENNAFDEHKIQYVTPLVSLGDPSIVPKQLFESLKEILPGLTMREMKKATDTGFEQLNSFNQKLSNQSRNILEDCANNNKPCILVLARPYHMDTGIGHEIETDLQTQGYPVLWSQYLPTDPDIMEWAFSRDLALNRIQSPFDISDVWPSSFSSNTNEILWGAKVAARIPWIACVIRLSSYECGMDQPTYSPVQQIVEKSGTLFFSFQELDSTKPAGSVKIRIETIAHYLDKYSEKIINKKSRRSAVGCPLFKNHELQTAI